MGDVNTIPEKIEVGQTYSAFQITGYLDDNSNTQAQFNGREFDYNSESIVFTLEKIDMKMIMEVKKGTVNFSRKEILIFK